MIVALLLGGCPTGADLENPERYVAPCDPPQLFISSCSSVACHGDVNNPMPPLNTDLVSPGLVERLLDVPASYDQVTDNASCPVDSPELLIDSQNPERSLLLTKLEGTHACGEQMPYFDDPLDQNAINCVRTWINEIVAGGAGTGGVGMGGAGTGGVDTGGAGTGGVGTGGTGTGGTGTGGTGTGGAGTGGTP